jgi:hypothetical protein
MTERWRCAACGAEFLSGGACRCCWNHVTIPTPVSRDGAPYGSPSARPYRRKYRPTVGLTELLAQAEAPRLYTFGYDSLRLPREAYVLCTGQPGSGKSTTATAIAISLALQGLRVLWVSAEEGAGPTTSRRFQQALSWFGRPKLPEGSLLVSDKRLLRDVHEEVEGFQTGGGDVVFLDSLTVLGAHPQWIEELSTSLGIVAISHMNRQGSPHGGSRPKYDADTHLCVEDFTITADKNRWCIDGAPRVWAVDQVAARWTPCDATVVTFPRRAGEAS